MSAKERVACVLALAVIQHVGGVKVFYAETFLELADAVVYR
jgi:hypothetical protein